MSPLDVMESNVDGIHVSESNISESSGHESNAPESNVTQRKVMGNNSTGNNTKPFMGWNAIKLLKPGDRNEMK